MSLAPNFRAQHQMVIRGPDRAVELRARTHQPRPAALSLGPRPEGDQLTSSLNHEGSREDRVPREMLRIHPVLRTEIDLPGDDRAFKLSDAGDLAHLAHRKESGFEIDQGAGHISGGAGMRHVRLLAGLTRWSITSEDIEATALSDRWILLLTAILRLAR